MAISTNTNPIIICKGKRITTLAELQENFDISKVCAYAKGGRLSQWLVSIGENAVNDEIQGIDFSLPDEMLAEDLMVLLGLSEEQQEKVINGLNSKASVTPSSEVPMPVVENDIKIKDIPQELPPILRKVMALKNEVQEKIQDKLKNDCRPDEFAWDMHFFKEIGCTTEQICEIRDYFGIPSINMNRIHSPMGIFINALLIKFSSRYKASHPELPGLGYSLDYKIIEQDAELLGFSPPVQKSGEAALGDLEVITESIEDSIDDQYAKSFVSNAKSQLNTFKIFEGIAGAVDK